jgi:hypothetical protein
MKTTRMLSFALPRHARVTALIFCLLGTLASSHRASAQWGHASDLQTGICTVVGASVFETRTISDGAGGLFVVWKDTRNSATGYDIYAQHLGSNGRPLWTANGVEVCRAAFIQELPQLVADGAGSVIVVWQDHRVFADGRSHLFAQRLDGRGNAQWAANGIRVSPSNASQHNAVIAPRAGGGVVVAWHDERGSPSSTLVGQAMDLGGNLLLGDSGVVLTTDTVVLNNLNAVPIAGGDTMILWRGNFAVVKAVRLSNPAVVVDAFPRPALVSGTNSVVAVSDGAGGVVAALFRFSGNAGVWAQRISSNLQTQWAPGGVLLGTNVSGDAFSEVAIAADGTGGAYVAWHTKPGNNRNLYLQRVSSTGIPLWTGGGVTVAATPEEDEFPALAADANGTFVLWRHRNVAGGNGAMALRLQRYSGNGAIAWGESVDVTSHILSIEDFAPVTDGAGGVIVGFNVFPTGGSLDVVAKRVLANGSFPQSRLINLSTRAFVGTGDQQLIGGFVVAGTGTKRVLVRGIGPRLADLGVADALGDPTLRVVNAAGVDVATNNNWGQNANAAEIASTAAQVGAFSLGAGSTDAALLLELDPGPYTAIVGGSNGRTGVALVEIYDADGPDTTSRLVNVASRGYVGTGGNVIIPGFVVSGDATMRVLVRAVGPTLGEFGVLGVVADPKFDFFGPGNLMLGTNDNWSANAAAQAAITAAVQYTGAFPVPVNSRDAGSVSVIGAGAHTVVISGVGDTTGVCLVEGYESF